MSGCATHRHTRQNLLVSSPPMPPVCSTNTRRRIAHSSTDNDICSLLKRCRDSKASQIRLCVYWLELPFRKQFSGTDILELALPFFQRLLDSGKDLVSADVCNFQSEIPRFHHVSDHFVEQLRIGRSRIDGDFDAILGDVFESGLEGFDEGGFVRVSAIYDTVGLNPIFVSSRRSVYHLSSKPLLPSCLPRTSYKASVRRNDTAALCTVDGPVSHDDVDWIVWVVRSKHCHSVSAIGCGAGAAWKSSVIFILPSLGATKYLQSVKVSPDWKPLWVGRS